MQESQKKEKGSPGVTGAMKHKASCHCGAVRFEVEVDLGAGASRCNCSICMKIGALAAFVKPSAFALLSGEESLGKYEWGPKISRRFFCKHCGIHCFGRGHLEEVGGDYVSVNFNCLEDADLRDVKVIYWDGRHNNWEAGPRATPWPLVPERDHNPAGGADRPSSSA